MLRDRQTWLAAGGGFLAGAAAWRVLELLVMQLAKVREASPGTLAELAILVAEATVLAAALVVGLIALFTRHATAPVVQSRLAESLQQLATEIGRLALVPSYDPLGERAESQPQSVQRAANAEPAGAGQKRMPAKPSRGAAQVEPTPPVDNRGAPPQSQRLDQGYEAIAPPCEAGNHAIDAFDGSAPLAASSPDQLVAVWERYLSRGDGRFNAEGLRRQLEAMGVGGEVVTDAGLGDSILGVALGDGKVYLLPHFDRTPAAVAEHFQQSGSSARMARIQRLVRAAVARRAPVGGLVLEVKGVVE